jgi:hypothetical protein
MLHLSKKYLKPIYKRKKKQKKLISLFLCVLIVEEMHIENG